MSTERESAEAPQFAVRIARGLVTHWQDAPLVTYAQAETCRYRIEELTGERGEIEDVLLSVALPAVLRESETDG